MPSGVRQFSNAAGLKRERRWLVVSKSPREPELEGALHVQAPLGPARELPESRASPVLCPPAQP